MLKKVKAAVKRDNKALLLAALFGMAFFALNHRAEGPGFEHLARHVSFSLLMFVFLYLMFALFSSAFRRHLSRELRDLEGEEVSRRVLSIFICYKEGVKAVVGVSLTLGWIAGLVFIVESFQDKLFVVPLLGGLAFSAFVFSVAYSFVALVDHIRYPGGQ